MKIYFWITFVFAIIIHGLFGFIQYFGGPVISVSFTNFFISVLFTLVLILGLKVFQNK